MHSLCGFAWIRFSCKGEGASLWRWIRAHGEKNQNRSLSYSVYGQGFSKDDYYGGVSAWVHEGGKNGQSVDIKNAYARAYANVLREKDISAYPMSRLD
jgi:hypothetical protein